jgi:hypothetical protein
LRPRKERKEKRQILLGNSLDTDVRTVVEWSSSTESSAVDAYEIRIVKRLAKAPVIYACSHVSDHAAIRRARSLTEDGDQVEVWRGLDCVYACDALGTHHGSA